MGRLILAIERVKRARALIEKARRLPVPVELGKSNLTYISTVKDLLRQARDLIKFISYTPSASAEIKAEVNLVFEEIAKADREILH